MRPRAEGPKSGHSRASVELKKVALLSTDNTAFGQEHMYPGFGGLMSRSGAAFWQFRRRWQRNFTLADRL
jgi:hypothetical protein